MTEHEEPPASGAAAAAPATPLAGRALLMSFVATVRHDGHGGVADDLADLDGAATWVEVVTGGSARSRAGGGPVVDDALHARLLDLRRAVRSLFARAVAPQAPSRADANRLLDLETALALVDGAAATLAPPRLTWSDGEPRVVRDSASPDPADHLLATLAAAAMDFLVSDDTARLRACQAPRCVRYFVQDDPRQEWCKPSCGNRARVARHYERRKAQAVAASLLEQGGEGLRQQDVGRRVGEEGRDLRG